jgi:hypothetical protein
MTGMDGGLALIDTNVWKYLTNEALLKRFRAAMSQRRIRGAVSPLIIDELVRIERDAERASQLRVACRRCWTRLLPMGLLDMKQLTDAIRIHRPEWLLAEPDVKRYVYEKVAYLTHGMDGFWQVAKNDPAGYARMLRPNEEIRREQQNTTKLAKAAVGLHFNSTDVTAAMSAPMTVGWPDASHPRLIESWRYQNAHSARIQLSPSLSGPMSDVWLSCYVDLSRIELADWFEFWADQITPIEASHFWLRSAVFHLQATRRVGPGVSGDLAIAGHLADVGTFITLDSSFGQIIERIRLSAPFSVARPIYANQYDELLDVLAGSELARD